MLCPAGFASLLLLAAVEPLDLPALVAEAERANPEVVTRRARADAAAEVPSQRSALPDPRLSVSYTNDSLDDFTLGTSQFSNVTLRWDQDVPGRSVRARAADLARADERVARAGEASARARLRERVIAAYAAIWRSERTDALLVEQRRLLEASVEAARTRYETGDVPQAELLRAQTRVRRIDLEREAVARDRRAAEIALVEATGRREDARFGPAGDLPRAVAVDPAALEAGLPGGAPASLEADAAVARADAASADAKVQTRPEWGWMAAYQYLGGLDPMVMGGFTVRLPLWKNAKQSRGIAQAEREAEAVVAEREAVENRARTRVRDLASEIETLSRMLTLYDEALLPQGQATIEATRAAFSTGKTTLAAALDELERVLADRREALELEARRVEALAELEEVSGVALLALEGTGGAR